MNQPASTIASFTQITKQNKKKDSSQHGPHYFFWGTLLQTQNTIQETKSDDSGIPGGLQRRPHVLKQKQTSYILMSIHAMQASTQVSILTSMKIILRMHHEDTTAPAITTEAPSFTNMESSIILSSISTNVQRMLILQKRLSKQLFDVTTGHNNIITSNFTLGRVI